MNNEYMGNLRALKLRESVQGRSRLGRGPAPQAVIETHGEAAAVNR